jgi:hypothetical protein
MAMNHMFVQLTAEEAEAKGPWHIAEVERNGIWRSASSNAALGKTYMTRAGAFCTFFLQDGCKGEYFVDSVTTAACKFFFKNKSDRDGFKEIFAEEAQKSQRLIPDFSSRIRSCDEGTIVEAYYYFIDTQYLRRMSQDGFGSDARALFLWAKHNCTGRIWMTDAALVFETAEDAALFKLKHYRDHPPSERKAEVAVPF